MELTIGEHAGFCFGVRRAVLKAFECAEKQLPCVTLGPLIHNPQEVERLRRAGIRSVETLDEVKPGETVMIRSHGVTPDVYRQCEARGIPVIDATCPHVAHIHQLVRQYSEHGDAVVIVGEADHPEVVGIAGWARGRVFILPDAQAAEQAELPQKALVVAQTTIRRDRFDSVLQVLRRRVPDLTERITICAATSQRQQEAEKLGHKLGVFDVGTLNDTIARGRMNDLILMQEALQEKKIGDIAEQIHESGRKLIMIAGPSSSGKTTFSHRLSIQLMAHGLKPHPIAVDNYFVNRVDSPRDENGNYDYEALNCIDVKQFNEDMEALLAGKRVELPVYNFVKGEREYKGDFLQLGAEDILVIEGIHCLNDDLSYSLPRDKKFKIYISALTQLNIDDHNRVPTTDGRLIRRMVRDARTRGASAQDTIRMWDSVRRGEERNIFPYQEEADAMFNSAFLYELSVLKQYAEPILYSVPRDSAEYNEAKRLLKFLDYFLGVSSEQVPHNSIVREFIGGSCFKV